MGRENEKHQLGRESLRQRATKLPSSLAPNDQRMCWGSTRFSVKEVPDCSTSQASTPVHSDRPPSRTSLIPPETLSSVSRWTLAVYRTEWKLARSLAPHAHPPKLGMTFRDLRASEKLNLNRRFVSLACKPLLSIACPCFGQ